MDEESAARGKDARGFGKDVLQVLYVFQYQATYDQIVFSVCAIPALGEVGGYFFRKKDPSRPSDINIRMMHGINKISIIVFLLGIIYIVLKKFL